MTEATSWSRCCQHCICVRSGALAASQPATAVLLQSLYTGGHGCSTCILCLHTVLVPPAACTHCSCAPCSLSILWGRVEPDWQRMGYFYEEGQTRERQSGVVRTNCIDCLDRTNVVQALLGRKHLESVLRRLQLLQPGNGLPEAFPGVRLLVLINTMLCPTVGCCCMSCCSACSSCCLDMPEASPEEIPAGCTSCQCCSLVICVAQAQEAFLGVLS